MQNVIDNPLMRQTRKRHEFLSVVLFVIIAYSFISIFFLMSGAGVSVSAVGAPNWAVPTIILLLISQIACAAAIYNWKRWGFWGYCALNVVGIIVDIQIGIRVSGPLVSVLAGIVILFGALQMGNENKAWDLLD